jgi:hypothetical protein
MQFLLGPLKWLLQFLLTWGLEKAAHAFKKHQEKQAEKKRAKEVINQIVEVDKQIDKATPEEIDELRKKKIALEESLLNGG